MDDLTLVNQAISGAILLAALAVALFFRRFWRTSRERLFLMLSLAFALLAAERFALILLPLYFVPVHEESRHWVYLIRLAAFLLILLGILEKNRDKRRQHPSDGGGG